MFRVEKFQVPQPLLIYISSSFDQENFQRFVGRLLTPLSLLRNSGSTDPASSKALIPSPLQFL